MAEAITEMIIPGTYIEVRSEGLIGVGGIAVGNIGVIGTASRGSVNEVQILSSFSDAREIFGEYDRWQGGANSELSLVRALQHIFDNGGSTVYAVRCSASNQAGDPLADAASLKIGDNTGTVVTLNGRTPGTWAHEIKVQVKNAANNAFIEENKQDVTANPLRPLHAHIAVSTRNILKVINGTTGKINRFTITVKASGTPKKGDASVIVHPDTGAITFHADDVPSDGDRISASYEVDKTFCREIEITYRKQKENYDVVDAVDIKRDIDKLSKFVTVDITGGAEARMPDIMDNPLPLTVGSNGENATPADYKKALALIDNEPVNIVHLAGLSFKDANASLLAHLENAENNGKDRIAVVGADSDDVGTVSSNADAVSDDRLILTAPGIKSQDIFSGSEVSLNASYTAAAITGIISSLAVQVSPTNKVLRVSGLTKYYNDGELKKLIGSRCMILERKSGYRIVKGITTDDGAFKQVSVRRIVDYAKAGTRLGSLPYIGRLNNARVRGALKATLNGFLSDMVLNEALTEFSLDVSATRDQEIAGIALVTMFLKPTFSIDYIKVIMNLS